MLFTLKSLWARKKQNVWIFAELVLISIVSWFVLDPLFVIVYNTWVVPDGYDIDRLCVLSIRAKSSGESKYESIDAIKTKLKNMPEVESVSITYENNYPNGGGFGEGFYGHPEDTTKWFICNQLDFRRGEEMYKTLGMVVLDGDTEEEGVVITRSLALALFGKTNVAGARMCTYDDFPSVATDISRRPIAAVVEDIRVEKYYLDSRYAVFQERDSLYLSEWSDFLVRLKDGVNADAFCARIRPSMQKELSSGDFFINKAQSMREIVNGDMRLNGVTGDTRKYISLAIFFMANLCLGTIGTFWLQTRKRKEEIGIRRSFGASRRRIMGEFLMEGLILTAICHLLGCFLFFQYAYSFGLSMGMRIDEESLSLLPHYTDSWILSFAPHFFAVSIFIYLVILLTVSIGIAIPVWNICRTKPVETLKDE